jgi:hypothetical protein
MKNDECTVCIGTRRGRTWTYHRDKDGWTQTGPTGRVHRMTAEQLLSHLLPPLAGRSPAVVRVEPGRPTKKRERPLSRGGESQGRVTRQASGTESE